MVEIRRCYRLVRGTAWVTGIGYALIWAPVIWLVVDGDFIVGNPACAPERVGPTVFWVCSKGAGQVLAASIVNAALGATFWAPVAIALGLHDPNFLGLAILVIALHLFGFAAMTYTIWRMTWTLYLLCKSRVRALIAERATGPA